MLVIDDNMLRLSKMQEALLRNSSENREENLEKYKETVMEIDSRAFADILEELSHMDEHNQSLEEELKFLEKIRDCYNQLEELQLRFRKVCSLYGNDNLVLSNLSRLNIDYIDNRVNAINGYLINIKNIDENKKKLQTLNEQLIEEEKKKDHLAKKLLELECVLRDNFCDAEGRFLEDGQLKYVSVISEYDSLGFDFRRLLQNSELLDQLLEQLNNEKNDVSEKLRTAEICYNSIPSVDSKQILDDINVDFYNVMYRLTMLKILKLLSQNYDNYDLFKEKRDKILDLIKYRLSCFNKLGIRVSIDPFGRTKVKEQLEVVSSFADNSKDINNIRKEISQLNSRTEEMVKQNSEYLISLSETKDLLKSTVGLGDIDISSVHLDVSVKKEVEITDDLVIGVRDTTDKLNMSIVKQKTSSVIRRVNQMISVAPVDKKVDAVVPDLVIVPKKVEVPEVVDDKVSELEFIPVVEEKKVLSQPEVQPVDTLSDIFETVVPFSEPSMFVDRSDNVDSIFEEKNSGSLTSSEFEMVANKTEPELVLNYDDTELPDAFWTMDDEDNLDEEENSDTLSFDEQIDALLADTNENNKTKKLVA